MEKEYRRYKRGGFFLACLTAAASCFGVLSSGGASLAQTTGTTTPQVAGGSNHTLSLKSDGTVWAWGLNAQGQLGNGTNTTGYPYGTSIPVQVSNLSSVIAVAAGNNYSLAVKSDNTLWAWGSNDNGKFGDRGTKSRNIPKQMDITTTESGKTRSILFGTVSAGYEYILAMEKGTGRIWGFGSNAYGQLGNGATTTYYTLMSAYSTNTDPNYTAVAAGDYHSLALRNDGTVRASGYNGYGQLGNGKIGSNNSSTRPVVVSNLSDVIAVAAGSAHSLALKSDGTIWAWGLNANGQLGNSSTTNSHTPVQVNNLSDVIAVAAGGKHSLALKSDGTIWAWGYNANGQLGDDTTTDSTIPVQVGGLSSYTSVAAGGNHSLALEPDGTVWAKGSNWYGQLGDGTTWENAIYFDVAYKGTKKRSGGMTIKYKSTDANTTGTIQIADLSKCPYPVSCWEEGTYDFSVTARMGSWTPKGSSTLTVVKGARYDVTFNVK